MTFAKASEAAPAVARLPDEAAMFSGDLFAIACPTLTANLTEWTLLGFPRTARDRPEAVQGTDVTAKNAVSNQLCSGTGVAPLAPLCSQTRRL